MYKGQRKTLVGEWVNKPRPKHYRGRYLITWAISNSRSRVGKQHVVRWLTVLCSERRSSIMSNRSRSASWMEEDDNDFEVASCIGACGRLLRGPYYHYKPGRPLIEPLIQPEPVEEEELKLNADHFEVHQVGVKRGVCRPRKRSRGSFYLRACMRARPCSLSPAADVASRVATPAVLPCVRQRSAAPGHWFSPRRHCYVSSLYNKIL